VVQVFLLMKQAIILTFIACNSLLLTQCCSCSFIAGSNAEDTQNIEDAFCESFWQEETVPIGLDTLCSKHLFPFKNDFITGIVPVTPVDISDIGGEITIQGKGTVRLRICGDDGKWIDKLIHNMYFAPSSPVWLLLIMQLCRECSVTEIIGKGDTNTLKGAGETVTIHHPPPATVPFLEAYVGDPPPSYTTYYAKLCAFMADSLLRQLFIKPPRIYSEVTAPNLIPNDSDDEDNSMPPIMPIASPPVGLTFCPNATEHQHDGITMTILLTPASQLEEGEIREDINDMIK
jgi:hypothetical protein